MITSRQRLAAGAGLSLLAATAALAQTDTQAGTTAPSTTIGRRARQPRPRLPPAGDPVVAIVNGQTLHRSDVDRLGPVAAGRSTATRSMSISRRWSTG